MVANVYCQEPMESGPTATLSSHRAFVTNVLQRRAMTLPFAPLWCPLIFLLLLAPLPSLGQEICDNGVDDNGNGLIDLNDPECDCPAVVSLVPNPSFEEYDCLPTDHSQMSCATGWAQATGATSDYWHLDSDFYLTHAGNLLPSPTDGSAFVGVFMWPNWREYVGVCLDSPMLAGETYVLSLDVAGFRANGPLNDFIPMSPSPLDLTLFGLGSCVPFPISPPQTLCPQGWDAIASVTYTPNSEWEEISITFTPDMDVHAIMFGSPCGALPPEYGPPYNGYYAYFLFDNFSLHDMIITLDGTWCGNDLSLTATPNIPGSHSFQWYREGIAIVGQTSATLEVAASGLEPGTYQFRFFSPNDDCQLAKIEVPPPPSPIISLSASLGCAPHTVVLSDSTTEFSISACSWDLGNGDPVSGCTITHTYNDPGTYLITLTALTDDGCTLDASTEVVVIPPPAATFSLDLSQACIGQEVHIINTMPEEEYTDCLWDLGDGSLSQECALVHAYEDAGEYNVTLTITTPEGCSVSSTMEAAVTVPNNPAVTFSAQPTTICPGDTVAFSNTMPTSFYTECSWHFGEGGSSAQCMPVHSYPDPGSYDVSLAVVTNDGCLLDTVLTNFIEVVHPPVAGFEMEPSSGCIPLTVSFTNISTGMVAGSNTAWDLGNGTQSTSAHTSTTYSEAGEFPVLLSVTDATGCTDTAHDTVITHPPPIAMFTVGPDSSCAPALLHFVATTDPNMVGSCDWDLGNGHTSNDCSLTHTYHQPGTYPVTLRVTSPDGCQGDTTVSDAITVLPVPQASFMHDPRYPDVLTPEIQFTETASDDVISWEWWFGEDGSLGTSQLPHPAWEGPETPGEYPVMLVVANDFCTDTTLGVIIFDDALSIHVPNAFTPDGDGINDTFSPVIMAGSLPTTYRLIIFDRWGQEIFVSTRIGEGWSGSINGHAPKTDVYVWKLQVEGGGWPSRTYTGHVTILK